ncbi:MAG: IS110 family transposase, partial [Lachnospiraceae bacterium]|nr:IS110 family transposase [Lachnospiraceae bacterium]
TPGERSSGESRRRTGITRAGNAHIRRLLVEAAQGYGRGRVGYKSKALKARQSGSSTETIAYADRANERLSRRYYNLTFSGKAANVAKTAVAREPACFIWGMMTDHTA